MSPLEKQAAAQRKYGYGDITLTTDGDFAVVRIKHGSDWHEVIREYIGPMDGTIHHTVTSIGIADVIESRRGVVHWLSDEALEAVR